MTVEALHKPRPRSLHPLQPPRDARPEHPQPVPLTIGAIPLLRRLLSFGGAQRRVAAASAQRHGADHRWAACGGREELLRACSGSGTAIWWHFGMRVLLASMSSIGHQLAIALYAWDRCVLGGCILAYVARSARSDQVCTMGPPSRPARWPRRRRDLLRLGSATEKKTHVAGCAVRVNVVW